MQIEKYSTVCEPVHNQKENFEKLGYNAQLLVSNPNTPDEVKDIALNGEVTKYAELKE